MRETKNRNQALSHTFFVFFFMHTPTPKYVSLQTDEYYKDIGSKSVTNSFFSSLPSTHDRTNEKRVGKNDRTHIFFGSFVLSLVFSSLFRSLVCVFLPKTVSWESNAMIIILFCLLRRFFVCFVFVGLFSTEVFSTSVGFRLVGFSCVYISRSFA